MAIKKTKDDKTKDTYEIDASTKNLSIVITMESITPKVTKVTVNAMKYYVVKDKTVAVNKGSAYESWARDLEGKIGWKIESFGTQTDAVQAVLAGRADANVAGNTAIAWAVKNSPQLELSYLYSTGLVWAAPTRKDSAALRNTLDVAIECMKLDGTMAKMHEKWFGIPPAPGSAAVTVFPGYGVPDMPGYDPTPHTPSCS